MQSETILKHQIDYVMHKNMQELREQFQELYGFNWKGTSIFRLWKRIIYRLQELYYGGVSAADMAILTNIADKDRLSNLKGVAKRAMTIAGTKLCRIWRGEEYTVIVGSNGKFSFKGHVYKSLSAIAYAITGTKRNGKQFFGVKS